MNHEHLGLEPASPASQSTPPAEPAREPYATPRLTNYGRFQHITGTTTPPSPNLADDDAIFDGGAL